MPPEDDLQVPLVKKTEVQTGVCATAGVRGRQPLCAPGHAASYRRTAERAARKVMKTPQVSLGGWGSQREQRLKHA